jgi:S-formylglutathione hydrolase
MEDVMANSTPEVISTARCFDGTQYVFRHRSEATGTEMRFAAFVPSQGAKRKLPVVWFLAGLTCTEENFTAWFK